MPPCKHLGEGTTCIGPRLPVKPLGGVNRFLPCAESTVSVYQDVLVTKCVKSALGP